MSGELKLKFRDIVVRYGRVLKAFKISKGMVFLKPYFKTNNNSMDLIYSLPLKNIGLTKIRRIVSKEKLDSLFELILNKFGKDGEVVISATKELLGNNDLTETMKVVKNLWLEKEAGLGSLSGGKLTAYRQALDQTTEEVAAVRGLSLEKAKIEVVSALRVGSRVNN